MIMPNVCIINYAAAYFFTIESIHPKKVKKKLQILIEEMHNLVPQFVFLHNHLDKNNFIYFAHNRSY